MATPLDFGILKQFEVIFPFILVTTVMFVVFSRWTPLGKNNRTLAGILAFSVGVLTMFSPIAVRAITLAAPWFVITVFFLILVLLGFYTLGVKEENILTVLKDERFEFINIILVIVFISIAAGAVGKAVTEQGGFGPGTQTGQEAEFYQTIFHPKILGVFFILMIAFFTIQQLSRKVEFRK